MTKYRKRPIAVEAVSIATVLAYVNRLSPSRGALASTTDCHDVPRWVDDALRSRAIYPVDSFTGLGVNTLEGPVHGEPADMLIRGIAGELYPCKPDVFAATYVEERDEPAVGGATTRHAIEDRLSAAIDAIDDLLNSTTVARDKALALRGAQDKQALLARIDADAIVARIFGAIAGGEFIILGEREAVRAIVCDAVTAGQDAGIEIARLQREHRAKHAAEQVDGCAMLRELGTDPARWADACASILISIVGDPSKNEGHTAAREALLGWFANAMSVAGDQARAERMRLGPTAVRYASGLEDGELADAVANGIVRYLEDGTASVATPQGTVTARSGDWIVRDYQHHYHVASSTRPAIAGAERPLEERDLGTFA